MDGGWREELKLERFQVRVAITRAGGPANFFFFEFRSQPDQITAIVNSSDAKASPRSEEGEVFLGTRRASYA